MSKEYSKCEMKVIIELFEEDIEGYIKNRLNILRDRHNLRPLGLSVKTTQIKVKNKNNEVEDIHLTPKAKLNL